MKDIEDYFEKPKKRSFLFLQGPHGDFFKKLSKRLVGIGNESFQICFNGGDIVDHSMHNCYLFIGKRESWPCYIRNFILDKKITDLILYGDKRYYHTSSIVICEQLNIRVWTYEEGYLRPDYITLEPDGVNSNSRIKSIYMENLYELHKSKKISGTLLKEFYKYSVLNSYYEEFSRKKLDGQSDKKISRPTSLYTDNYSVNVNNSFQNDTLNCPMSIRVKAAIKNYLGIFFLYPFFPFYKWHREQRFASEIFGWIYRKICDVLDLRQNNAVNKRIAGKEFLYFVFPLQLDSDAQIKCASSFRDLTDAIECVLKSFCIHASKDCSLVIKLHPLYNSFFNCRRYISNLSESLNIKDRVLFISECSNKELISNSIGMVAINSTMGILALQHKKPVITLGNAIYAAPGLAQSSVANGVYESSALDRFWQNHYVPNKICINLFFNLMKSYSLVYGNFYSDEGIEFSIDGSLKKFGFNGIRHCRIFSEGIKKIPNLSLFLNEIDCCSVIGWGYKKTSIKAQRYAKSQQLPYFSLEDGFIKSLIIYDREKENREFIFSLILDRNGIYYNVNSNSDLELLMTSISNWYTDEIKKDSAEFKKMVIDHEIVKFNRIDFQPVKNLVYKSEQVLVIDQTYGDASVTQGNASSADFELMLKDAIAEFDASNVYVKIHPNVITGKYRGYYRYSNLKKSGVNIIDQNVNSIALIKYFNHVYTVTSGMGFEALMCGCNVTCYGEPFYSGYGFTADKKSIALKKRKELINYPLELEALIAAVFFKYSIWIDPVKSIRVNPLNGLKKIITLKGSFINNK